MQPMKTEVFVSGKKEKQNWHAKSSINKHPKIAISTNDTRKSSLGPKHH